MRTTRPKPEYSHGSWAWVATKTQRSTARLEGTFWNGWLGDSESRHGSHPSLGSWASRKTASLDETQNRAQPQASELSAEKDGWESGSPVRSQDLLSATCQLSGGRFRVHR